MREIICRGKDKDDGNWYEGYYLQLHDTTYCRMPSDVEKANRLNEENEHHYIVFERMTDWGLPNKHLRAEVLPETVCQYTGLDDKNGRKIFEGDIVKAIYKPKDEDLTIGDFIIKWDKYYCKYVGYYARKENVYNPLLFGSQTSFEVIGNIFDNPELLKGDREELKKCQFCNGEADLESKENYSAHTFWRVVCNQCGCGTWCDKNGFGYEDDPGKQKAIDEWNNRA